MDERNEASTTDPRGSVRFGGFLSRAAVWLRRPLRICGGLLLVIGGIFGFLPILGFWMVPLGLSLLAPDVPAVARLLRWVNRKMQSMKRGTQNDGDDGPDMKAKAPD